MQDLSPKKTPSFNDNPKNPINKIIQLWSMQTDIAINFSSDKIHQKCIILVGDTNVGKTTLLYYLSGLKLNLIEDSAKKTKQMQPQVIYQNATICNNQSTTQIPNIFSKTEGQQNFSLIDMPGMNDDRFISLISNIYTFEQIFNQTQRIKQFHIVFVISYEMFKPTDIKQSIREFTEHFNIEILQKEKNISLIFTKTQDDFSQLKEKFFQFLEGIKEEADQEEEDRNISKFIQILIDLNSQQELVYCFPNEQPDQRVGEEIIAQIFNRKRFIKRDRDDLMLLNEKMMENILLKAKLKQQTTFQANFMDLFIQLQKIIEGSIGMVLDLVKIMHNSFFKGKFLNKNNLQKFTEKYSELLSSFILDSKIEEHNFAIFITEALSRILEKFKSERKLCLVNKALRQFFDCTNIEEITQNNRYPKFSFLADLSKFLGGVLIKVQKALKNIDQNYLLMDAIQNMGYFYEWISNYWFLSLSKVMEWPKITDRLKQMTKYMLKLKQNALKQLKCNQQYFSTFVHLSEKTISEADDESSSDEEGSPGPIKRQIPLLGSSLLQLIQKYQKPKYESIDFAIAKVQRLISQQRISQIQLNRKKRDDKIVKIVQNLQRKIVSLIDAVTKADASEFPLSDQELASILIQLKYTRHNIYLQSVGKNFFSYVNFFIIILKYKKDFTEDTKKLKIIFEQFIENICQLLQGVEMYETACIIYMFSDNLEKTLKTLKNGLKLNQLGQEFIMQLMQKLQSLINSDSTLKKINYNKCEHLIQIITKSYNYLIAECSPTRKQQHEYQNRYIQLLEKINSLPIENSRPQITHKLNLNYALLELSAFDFYQLPQRIKHIQKRNSQSKLPLVYKEIFSKKKKPQQALQNSKQKSQEATPTS